MKESVFVRITSGRCWYAWKVGSVFEVYDDSGGTYFRLKKDVDGECNPVFCVMKTDCVVIDEQEPISPAQATTEQP